MKDDHRQVQEPISSGASALLSSDVIDVSLSQKLNAINNEFTSARGLPVHPNKLSQNGE